MLPDRVSNPGPLTYESGALPIVLRGPAIGPVTCYTHNGESLVDYAISSQINFKRILGFQVHNFNEYSNHAPIYLALKMNDETQERVYCKWDDEQKNAF